MRTPKGGSGPSERSRPGGAPPAPAGRRCRSRSHLPVPLSGRGRRRRRSLRPRSGAAPAHGCGRGCGTERGAAPSRPARTDTGPEVSARRRSAGGSREGMGAGGPGAPPGSVRRGRRLHPRVLPLPSSVLPPSSSILALPSPQNHGTAEPRRLEKSSQVPIPAHPTVPTARVPQCRIPTAPGHLQGRRIPPPWAAVPLHHRSLGAELSLMPNPWMGARGAVLGGNKKLSQSGSPEEVGFFLLFSGYFFDLLGDSEKSRNDSMAKHPPSPPPLPALACCRRLEVTSPSGAAHSRLPLSTSASGCPQRAAEHLLGRSSGESGWPKGAVSWQPRGDASG